VIFKNLQHLGQFLLHTLNYITCGSRRLSLLGTLPGVPPLLQTCNRKSLFISHPLNLEERLDIFSRVDTLATSVFLRLKKMEFRFPEAENIRGKAGQATDFTDLIEKLFTEGCSAGCA